jgi:hypothetical protein
MYVWDAYKINYRLICGLNPKTSTHQYFAFVTFLSVIYLALVAISLLGKYGDTVSESGQAWITVVLTTVVFYFGLEFLDKSGRYTFFNVLYRIIAAPRYTTRFQDFFIGDQFVSILAPFRCFGILIDFTISGSGITKGFTYSSTWYCTLLQMLPFWWRSMQCIRRYYDGFAVNAGPTQLFNFFRYMLGGVWMLFWGLYLIYPEEESLFGLTVIFGVLFNGYSYYWDVVMDWGLGNGRTLAKRNNKAYLLYFPEWIYYCMITLNLVERFVWLPFFLYWGYKENPGIYIYAFIEMIRRFQWNFFRVEIEHVRNCEQYQVTPEVPLPFATTELFNVPNEGCIDGYQDGDHNFEDDDDDDDEENGNISSNSKAKAYKHAAKVTIQQNEAFSYLRKNEQQV